MYFNNAALSILSLLFGYFLDKLKDNSIITNVVTTKENKANGILEFKLEGDLTV